MMLFSRDADASIDVLYVMYPLFVQSTLESIIL